MSEQLIVNHLGFLCDAPKIGLVREPAGERFQVEDMAVNASSSMHGRDRFETVYEGEIVVQEFPLGSYGLCDFSELKTPGVYRLTLPHNPEALSYQFVIADGVYHGLPDLFLDFMHQLRSGAHTSFLRGATHLDDGLRLDNGEALEASGGWYDAGDTRKWMAHSTLPAWGFLEVVERLGLERMAFREHTSIANDFVSECIWGLDIICKLQDPDTGMIFENVGGGGERRPSAGQGWWYENHAGCTSDNADNRFTDNIPGSGDERSIRTHYSPIVQYVSIAMLARGWRFVRDADEALARRWQSCVEQAWTYSELVKGDEFHNWVSVRSWRLLAMLERSRSGWASLEDALVEVRWLLDAFTSEYAFWPFERGHEQPYRGILHAAQPVIALAEFVRVASGHALAESVRVCLQEVLERYVMPLSETNPYGFIPFGLYRGNHTQTEVYRKGPYGLLYRYCGPVNHPQQVNHGLSGHWMSWAHALALCAKVLDDERASTLAWRQIHWLLGMNDDEVSFISGVGYNNPMPHSRFLGTLVGGFMNGFCGSKADIPHVDMKRGAEWNSTEYWNAPLASCMLALAHLLPMELADSCKLGRKNA